MKQKTVQLLGAFLMGVLLPALLLQLSTALPERQSPQETAASQPQSAQQDAAWIPVLTADGSVQMMELDTYLLGVVLAEMPADFELEALKAQAIVARTYALKRQEEGSRHPQGAVCMASACCQAYTTEARYLSQGGTQQSVEKIRQAVLATAGEVLTYEGELIEATYFSCSGGRTEDAAAVWGTDIPYLQAVDSPGEEAAAKYSAQVWFSPEKFSAALGASLSGSPEDWLGVVTYTEGGGVASMVIGGTAYSGVELRSLLGLNSTSFTMTADDSGITVNTLGHGHRVGMSQYGADAMAAAGSTCEQILSYYYQGTRIDKTGTLG